MAHVDSGAIQQAMKLCRESIDKLEQASRSVKNKYEHAGSGWKDSKYSELGGIIGECVQALQEPTGQLRDLSLIHIYTRRCSFQHIARE